MKGHWPTAHQELFAVKHSFEHFRPYLLGRKLTIITDHANLQWLFSISPQQSKLACRCLSMAENDFKIEHRAVSANVVPDVLSCTSLTHPSTTGDDLFLPPQPVTCFLTSLIGFDIPYLGPSCVSEIFSDSLTCLTLACNPLSLQCLTTCPKSHPSRSQSKPFPLPTPPLDKSPLITPSLKAEPNLQAPNCADPQDLYLLNFSRLSFANKQRQDKCLGPLYHYLVSDCDDSELANLTKSDQSWVK